MTGRTVESGLAKIRKVLSGKREKGEGGGGGGGAGMRRR